MPWTGAAAIYAYKAGSKCDPDQRSPDTPVGTLTQISRTGWNPQAQCTREDDVDTGSGVFDFVLYTCQHGSLIKQTHCNHDCSTCTGVQTIFDSITYNSGGACFSSVAKSFQFFNVVTDPGVTPFNLAMAQCLVAPMQWPTPPPTPASWATCNTCIAGGSAANLQWCWGEKQPDGTFAKAHCATPGGRDCSKARSTCAMDVDCACSACDDSERCGGPAKRGSSSKAGLGVGLGLGIPAMAAGLFLFQKKRLQARALSTGTANQALTGAAAANLEPAEYSQL